MLKSILGSIQDQIMINKQMNFSINLLYHLGDKKLSKLTWSSLDHLEITTNLDEYFSDLQKEISSEVNKFYSQSDSHLFECDITVNINEFIMPKLPDAIKSGTIKFSIFGINSSPEVIDILTKKTENLVAANSSGSDKKKAKLISELSVSEQITIKDFKNFFEYLDTQNPISMSFVDYRFLVEDLEGPMTEEEKMFVSKYLKLQSELSNLRVSNTRAFLEKMVHIH